MGSGNDVPVVTEKLGFWVAQRFSAAISRFFSVRALAREEPRLAAPDIYEMARWLLVLSAMRGDSRPCPLSKRPFIVFPTESFG